MVYDVIKSKFGLRSAGSFKAGGDRARDEGRWVDAAAEYRRHLDQHPADAGIWIQFGHVLKESGNVSAAEDAYRRAIGLNAGDVETRMHLAHMLKRTGRKRAAGDLFAEVMRIAPMQEAVEELRSIGRSEEAAALISASRPEGAPRRMFELRDLFQYLDQHSTVTGISRVVLGLVRYVLEIMPPETAEQIDFVHQAGDGEGLSVIERSRLDRIVHLASAVVVDHDSMVQAIADARHSSRPIQARAGDLYFIPGAFWDAASNPGFIPSLKRLGVIVGAYIYDLIPITHPQYCMPGLTHGFNMAFAETAPYYDFVFTISDHVAQQTTQFIERHHLPKVPVVAVPLAHEMHFEPSRRESVKTSNPALQIFDGSPFVLCVCTIEARKNHVYLFNIWRQMMQADLDVPDLVFVGRPGWRVDDLMGQIEASDHLDGKLHIFHGLSDDDLTYLYQRCRFTVFPSFVEGWGLPVGESLNYGKVCVASSASSIPEVGGDFVVYIDPFNLTGGYETIRRLLTDDGHLAALEDRIRREFVPRTWKEVAGRFFSAITSSLEEAGHVDRDKPMFCPRLAAGTLLRVRTLAASLIRSPDYIENPLRLIFSQGWSRVEAEGVRMREAAARIQVTSDYAPGEDVHWLVRVGVTTPVTDGQEIEIWGGQAGPVPHGRRAYRLDGRKGFWVRAIGTVDGDGTMTLQFRLKGTPGGRAAFPAHTVCVQAIAYAASKDHDARLSILEDAALNLA